MELKQLPDGKIELLGLGLKLEVDPKWLFTETISFNARKIIDSMIEKELKEALEAFKESGENADEFYDRLYKKECTSLFIKKIALIERELVNKLHSDGECIELDESLVEIRAFACSVWRYDSYYGFKSAKRIELK